MSWNDGIERKKFENAEAKQEKEFRKLGMTDDQIQEIYQLDLEVYKGNRVYAIHNQSLEAMADEEDNPQQPTALIENFTVYITSDRSDPYWWINEIEDKVLLAAVKALSDDEKLIIKLKVFDKLSQDKVAKIMGVSRYAFIRRWNQIRKKFYSFKKNAEVTANA